MAEYTNAYESLAEFIVALDPIKVLAFHAPESTQDRVEELLEKKEELGLTPDEQGELDQYLIYEHIVRLAKSRARLNLSKASA
jgi:hypothetical protein